MSAADFVGVGLCVVMAPLLTFILGSYLGAVWEGFSRGFKWGRTWLSK